MRSNGLLGTCAALALAAALGLLAAPGPARADDNGSFYDLSFGKVLESLGLKQEGDRGINYRERPPLVIPSNQDLPPPEKTQVIANPAWPKDPDVTRRKLIEQQQRNRNVSEEREREQNPLPPNQLAPGPRPRGVENQDTEATPAFGKLLSPSELGYKGGMLGKMFRGKEDDVASFTGEPPRTDLTAPPLGYQTPSPNQPYGVGQTAAKPEDYFLHRSEIAR